MTTMQTNTHKSVSEIQAIYDLAYSNPGLMGTHLDVEYSALTKKTLLDFCVGAPSNRLLDLGTGDGDFWQYSAPDVEAHAIDISEVGVRRAHGRFGRILPAVALAEHLPYPSGYFGAIAAADTIEHVFDIGDALQAISRSLAPGGKFALSVPAPKSLRTWALNRFVREPFSPKLFLKLVMTVARRAWLFGKPAFQPIDRDLSLQAWCTHLTESRFVIDHVQAWPSAPLEPIVYLIGTTKQ